MVEAIFGYLKEFLQLSNDTASKGYLLINAVYEIYCLSYVYY